MIDRRYALAVVIYCSLIFLESSRSIPYQADQLIPGIDKVVHAGMYAVLAALVSLGLRGAARPYTPRVQFFVPIAFVVLYGMSDEIHQHFVPTRSFDPWDEVSNTAGAVLAQYFLVIRRWGLRLEQA